MYCISMIYNVILNSNLRTSGTVANAYYNFDWCSSMKEGEYSMTWALTTGNIANITDSSTILVSAELGQSKSFICSAINTNAQNTNIIGTIIPNSSGNSFYYGDRNTSGSIILNRPTSNNFNVRLFNCDTIPLDITTIGNYILNLSFEKV
jgi:hypothetical protein